MSAGISVPVVVRRLRSADLALLRELNQLFAAAFGSPEGYTDVPPGDTYLAALLGKDHVVALTAVLSGKVLGGPRRL